MNLIALYYGVGSNVLGNILMLGATLLLTRILDATEFGQFRVGSSFAILMIPFLALGGERLLSRLVQSNNNNANAIASVIVTVASVVILGLVLLAAAYPVLSDILFAGQIPPSVYYICISLIPVTIAYNLANTLWRHLGSSSKAQVHLNFTQRLIRAPMLITLATAWPSAISASLAMLAAQTLSLFQARRYLSRFPLRSVGSISSAFRTHFRELGLIGIPVAIMAAIDRLDVLLINAVMGVEVAGEYDLIYLLSLTAMFPAMAMSKTSEPFLFGLREEAARVVRLKQLQTRTFLMSCLAVAGIGLSAPILQKFLGNAGPDFASAALVLAAGLAFSSVHGPVIEYLQINGKTRISLGFVVAFLIVFLIMKYLAAENGSLILVAALAGFFYFTMRLAMSIYIYKSDGITMATPSTIALSFAGYAAVIMFVWRDWA
ncbi:MAG: hypothetical protein CMK97_05920 [Pseudomonas sp.]|nr:hypothetical protein [Pseudomonas sp.]MBB49470.1 hypothetical protein [Pseudomonadales bacterium]